ncbi:MAG: chromosomal replication initiator protein DnaA [Oscillospiraceae bacterium]|jgi:chromosomal replication initiator protein|nr:chromosomal replication initiator protein DnaA [Oscillospiraceae bacterium]
MESFMEVFNHVKSLCAEQITEIAYNLWIQPTEPVKFENDTAFIYVKSDFQKKILIEKYITLLATCFREVLGFEINVAILTESDINQQGSPVPEKLDLSAENPQKRAELEQSIQSGEYEYTFDTFIVGNSNNFAYAACKAVAQKQAGSYNPLFIYGPSGLGKTHLLLAVSNYIKQHNQNTNIIFVSGEAFTNELISAIGKGSGHGSNHDFHNKYRNADMLLVDDIQFIAGKESTQEEFFHTFNELHQLGKQIILTSDRPPKDIKTLEDRLRTRFEWGLLTDISPPDFETRIAIIRRKAELLQIEIPDEVAEFIANRLKNNIRQLEGAVKKLKAYKLLAGSPPSITVAQNVIRDILNDNQPVPVTVERIISEVARTFNVSTEDIRSKKRAAQISLARQVSVYVVRDITQMSLASIGEEFGGRDHATIVYALQQVEKSMEKDSHHKEIIEDIIKNIRNN